MADGAVGWLASSCLELAAAFCSVVAAASCSGLAGTICTTSSGAWPSSDWLASSDSKRFLQGDACSGWLADSKLSFLTTLSLGDCSKLSFLCGWGVKGANCPRSISGPPAECMTSWMACLTEE